MPKHSNPVRTKRKLALEDLPDVLTAAQAAKAVDTTEHIIKAACRAGQLKAFMPGGRTLGQLSPGRGMGYRIHKADLEAWWFGQQEEAPSAT